MRMTRRRAFGGGDRGGPGPARGGLRRGRPRRRPRGPRSTAPTPAATPEPKELVVLACVLPDRRLHRDGGGLPQAAGDGRGEADLLLRRLQPAAHPAGAGGPGGRLRLGGHGADGQRRQGQHHPGRPHDLRPQPPGGDRAGGQPGRDHHPGRPGQAGPQVRHRRAGGAGGQLHPDDAGEDGGRPAVRGRVRPAGAGQRGLRGGQRAPGGDQGAAGRGRRGDRLLLGRHPPVGPGPEDAGDPGHPERDRRLPRGRGQGGEGPGHGGQLRAAT